MKPNVCSFVSRWVAIAFALTLFGCSSNGSSSSSNNSNSTSPTNGTVSMMLSDAATDDWATIGVKVLAISLIPQGGGSPVSVYTAPSTPPVINLVQLDQLSEILGNLSVPPGTYTGASLTIGGNPGDVILTAASDPETGFAGTPGATVPASQIDIQGTKGSVGSLTVPVNVNFVSNLVVTAAQSNALDLEFDLSHPAFLVAHQPLIGGATIWAVNFNGPLRHHVIDDITRLVLRHLYGSVTSVAADGSSMTVTKVFPVVPATTPETSIASSQSLQILADATNGTLFYNVDAKTHSTIFNFTSQATALAGKFVRVAARYQANGTLVATRVWVSSSFNSIWLSPEGHVLHVTASSVVVEDENGTPVTVNVDANTQFFFHAPANPKMDVTPIGTGTAFLSNMVRGFKVHVSVVDPLAAQLLADTIDIEIARFDGSLSLATQTGFTFTRTFATATDNYTRALTYISSNTANGKDPLSGSPITGFKYWLFAYPTLVTSGSGAITSFSSIANGSVNFGGSVAPLTVYGASYAVWGDPANSAGWSIPWAVLTPSPVPLGAVSSSWISNSGGGSFTMTVAGGTSAITVTASSTLGSATLVYQVDRSNGIVTISPVDLTTTAGQNAVAAGLVTSTPVKVFGVPQANGSIKAYVIFYYTGIMPKT
jgi:Domain of unknown function (DUF4382)